MIESMADAVDLCFADLVTAMEKTNEFNYDSDPESTQKKIFSIFSEDDLKDKTKLNKYPVLGILYAGLQSSPGADRSGQGLAAILQWELVLLMDGKSVNQQRQHDAIRVLSTMRKQLLTRRAPTGHKWAFGREVGLGSHNNVLVYMQRWQTMVALTF